MSQTDHTTSPSTNSSEDVRGYVMDKLRQRNTYVVALVVGTLINGYGQFLVPLLRGHDHPWDRFVTELSAHPGLVAISIVIAYCFPVLVGLYSSVATRIANRELERNLRRLASFPEKNPNPVVEADSSGRVTHINPLARERFPNLVEEGAAHPILEGLPAIIDRLKSGTQVSCDREVALRDLIYTQNIVYLPESQVVRLYIHDVTGLKELQLRIQRNLAELERAHKELHEAQGQLVLSEKMAALGQLVAGIAHEINTPIGAIHSTHDTLDRVATKLDAIATGQEDNRRLGSIVKVVGDAGGVIKTASQRIINIVDGMRNFARLDEAELKKVDINEGLRSTLKMISREMDGIEVVDELGDVPPTVCYPGRLNQAFLALLLNGAQSIQGAGKIWLSSEERDGNLVVTIRDSGIGIPEENVEKIFQPGFTTKGVGVGTGLGLSICQQTIKDHGGELTIQSKLGEGTTATIVLPISQNESAAPKKTGQG